MNVKSIERKGNEATVVVEIDKELMESGVNKAYMKARKSIQLPGFRKGKAPRKMIEAMYGAHVFYEDGLEEIFPEIYDFAIAKQDFKAIGRPNLTDMQIGDDNIVTLTLTTEVYPEVTLGQYKGLEAPKANVKVMAADVNARLKEMAERNSRLVSVERAVKKGDTANIDFEGFDNGVAFDGGKGENFDLEIGSGSFVPGFEDQLMGMKVGEEKDIDITFPEDYTPELAGKPVVFHVKVNEVKVKEVPAIDDEFAKDVSEFDTLKELKADLKKKITDERKTAAQHAFEDALMQKVADGIEADIPEDMVVLQSQRMMENFKQQLAAQGIPFDQYVKMTGMDEDAIQKQSMEPALKQVRMDLAVSAIVKAENLEASDEEVENEMKTIAEKYGMDLESIKKYLPASDVKEQVIREKVIKVVADSAVAVEPEEKAEEKSEDKAEEKKEDKE